MRDVVAKLATALIIIVAAVVAVFRFAAIDATSHSNSDTLRPWIIQVAVIVAVAVLMIAVLRRGLGSRR
jgi:hypothetical protein